MQKSKLQSASAVLYAVTVALFLGFFIYLGLFENVSIQRARDLSASYTIQSYSEEEIEDTSAPIGVRREYRWVIDQTESQNAVLAFYLVHHYAEVYFDDELVYSLMPQKNNRIGKSISSNWVVIPVYPGDSGKTVRVVATPVYESVRNRPVEFQMGSMHTLCQAQLKKDLPQLVLAFACCVAGLFITLVQLFLICRKKVCRWDIFFLGNVVTLLGIWKITDTRFSPMMFSGNTMLLGYLTIGALFLSTIPLALYLHRCLPVFRFSPAPILSVAASGIALITLFCQVFGIADFKQMLPLVHVIIIALVLLLLAGMLIQFFREKAPRSWRAVLPNLLLICGAVADLLRFYLDKNSAGLIFTLFALLLYLLILFIQNILDANRLAYTDIHTGLFNRRRWDALMRTSAPTDESIAVMMLDLNGLKHVNDTMGHEAGDKMIFNFANILRNIIPPTNTICRWGGDEFVVMVTHAERVTVEGYLQKIRDAVSAYNASGEKPALHYAAGYVLSDEYPTLSRQDLLQKADERMYCDKNQWYAEHSLY